MSPSRFTLDNAALARLFALWSVPLPDTQLVIVALRGALPQSAQAATRGFARSATLTLAAPDYVHMRCTIALWDRHARRVFVAPGSTVPHRDNVLKAAARRGIMKGRGTNQLEPGLYTDLAKGEHLQGKPQGHAALRQTGFRFYRRAHLKGNRGGERLPLYTHRDPLYFGNPYDNLHCAWNPDARAAGYRSAGCVVVSGWPHSPRLADARPNEGAWKIFHDLIYAVPQKRFPLLLLPAEEAAAALASASSSPSAAKEVATRLIYGSEGDAVKALQNKLAKKGVYGGKVTGRLGVSTYRAWNQTGFAV